jgi:two-component system phosphate regulon sensor histidine kinase PhoR
MQINLTTKAIWILFSILIAGMIGTQSLWLLAFYMVQKDNLKRNVNQNITKSIDNEVRIRMSQMQGDSKGNVENDSLSVIYGSEDTLIFDMIKSPEILKTEVLQTLTDSKGYSFQINTFDSLFHEEFQKSGTNITYNISFMDSAGTVLARRGDSLILNDKGAFRSDSIPIINGYRIQVVADSVGVPIINKFLFLLSSFSLVLIFTVGFIAFILTRRLLTEKKLNVFRNDFVNAFTHNMKTPLSQVLTTFENINDEKYSARPDMLKKHANLAFLSVYRIQRQIEQMLAISKSEAGNLLLNREFTDIKTLVEGLKSRFEISKTKPMSIENTYVPEQITAFIDRQLIEDVISNLIDNAIKYSGESVKINIDCFVKSNNLVVRVLDNGFGISEEDRKKIFEKYERGAAFGRQGGAKGFGLGLNYVRRVVLAHGGRIQLVSTLGQGSEFRVILPIN